MRRTQLSLFVLAAIPLTSGLIAGGCATGSSGDGLGDPITTHSSTSSGSGSSSGGGAGGSSTSSSTSSTSTTSSTSSTTSSSGGATCNLTHLVISEIRSRGTAGAADEFIELYNPTGSPVTLDSTWKIEGRSDSATSYNGRWTGTGKVIPAHGHFLLAGTGYAQSPAGDEALSSGVTDATSVRLVHGTSTIDAVCYAFDAASQASFTSGTGYTCEGTPADNTPHDNTSSTTTNVDVSIERKPGGSGGNCTDTGDNAADFATRTPATPMSSQSAPTP